VVGREPCVQQVPRYKSSHEFGILEGDRVAFDVLGPPVEVAVVTTPNVLVKSGGLRRLQQSTLGALPLQGGDDHVTASCEVQARISHDLSRGGVAYVIETFGLHEPMSGSCRVLGDLAKD
jgi:hypothetical protein